MIGRVGGGGDQLLALLQARTAKTRSAPKSAKEAEAAKVLQEKREKSDELLRTLTQMTDGMKRERKAAAAQKVERLKKELENLRKFSGGDPKLIARQAARIARELGAAAKEYASAGGGAAAAGATPSAPSEANAATPAGAAGGQGAQASADGATGDGIKAVAAEAARVAADAEAKIEQNGEAGEENTGTQKALSPEEERAQFVDKLNAAVGESERRAGEAAADKKFENEVRNLFAQAKALIEQQRRRAEAENREDNEFEQFAKDVTAAGHAIDQAFSGGQALSGGGMGLGQIMAQAPVNITV